MKKNTIKVYMATLIYVITVLYSCNYLQNQRDFLLPPSKIEISAFFPNGAEIFWPPVEDADGYTVFCETSVSVYTYTTVAPICVVDNLTQGIPYSVSISSFNEFQTSTLSDKMPLTIPLENLGPSTEEKPPILSVPQNITAKGTSSTEITVSWDKTEPETRYQVFYANSENTSLNTVETDGNCITIGGLTEGISYYIKLKKRLDKSFSDFSTPLYCKTLFTIPKSPETLCVSAISSTTLLIEWAKVYNAEKYIVYFGNNENTMEEYKTVPENRTTIDSLTMNTEYFVSLSAQNSAGISNKTVIQKGKTTCEIPKTPQNLSIKEVTVSSILLTWDPCISNPLYTILYGNTKSSISNEALAKEHSFFLDNLSENQQFYFKVQASNEAGASSWSEIIGIKTLITPPEPTTINTLKFNNSYAPTSVLIRWDKKERAQGYRVYRSLNQIDDYEQIADYSGSQFKDIEALLTKQRCEYFYKVESYNTGGSGGFSEVISGVINPPKLVFDVTGKGMSGYYEFYLDQEIFISEVYIDYADPLFVILEEAPLCEKKMQFRFKTSTEDSWGNLIEYDPITFTMGSIITYKCSSVSNQTYSIVYTLE